MIQDVIVRGAGKKGKGVFSLRNFKKGEFIFRSKRGAIIKREHISKLPKEDKNHLNQIEEGVFEIQKSPERYINHSCDPNVISKGRSYFALKNILRGEEITTDYRIGALREGWKLKCSCGSRQCSGIIIGDFFSLSKRLQKKYLKYSPKFIKKEHRRRTVRKTN